jgi:hypothetical protein
MAKPSVIIDIATEFTGKKAFDKAGKASFDLEKSVKKLAGTLGLAFSTQRIVAFGKASVKAFADDDRAITVLRQNLENLGLAYQATNAENFIAKLEEQAAILDDKLRPAYAQLSKITLSTTKTQELMTLAVDVSRSTGVEFSAVINTLSKAYIGNYKGLKTLNIGLSDAELKTKNFAEIQAILIKQSKGAGKAYIETFAGSIDKLSVASANAKEVIGEGLVDLFADMAGNGDIDQATANVNKFAGAVSGLLKDVSEYNLLDFVSAFVTGNVTEGTAQKLVKRPSARRFFTGGSGVSTELLTARREEKARLARIAADKKAAAAKIAADKKAADNAAKLAKAQSIFDIDKIQIEAALKGKITDEETLRLQLQRAILNEDFDLANKLQKQLEASQRATAALQVQINTIKPPTNPFAEMLATLEAVATLLGTVGAANAITVRKPSGGVLALEPEDLAPVIITPKTPATNKEPIPVIVEPAPTIPATNKEPVPAPIIVQPAPTIPATNNPLAGLVQPAPTIPATNNQFAGLGGDTSFYGGPLPWYMRSSGAAPTPAPAPTIIVNNNGSVIMQEEFVKAVNDAVVTANTQGLVVTRPGGIRSDEG